MRSRRSHVAIVWIRRLIVLDDNKEIVGVVSLGDLALEARDRSISAEALEAISEPGQASIGSAGNVGGVGGGTRSTASTPPTPPTTSTATSRDSGVGARTRPGEV